MGLESLGVRRQDTSVRLPKLNQLMRYGVGKDIHFLHEVLAETCGGSSDEEDFRHDGGDVYL